MSLAQQEAPSSRQRYQKAEAFVRIQSKPNIRLQQIDLSET